ncbi:BrnT family toxin [Skermanella rosea]|uniref:BrnT family toxin n=1 Tax=Skermanella rosea TaxID=1817965 RepID=UPI0019320BD2|nr:BrnT family toxin [Skermanella rosea]UEM05531.1 BrnT family toxin [Skermanella rosea]
MEFEWDPRKNESNLLKHLIDFDDARKIFLGPIQCAIDDRREYGETRYVAIGALDGVILTVVYTWRGEICRIISARRADKDERSSYCSTFPGVEVGRKD